MPIEVAALGDAPVAPVAAAVAAWQTDPVHHVAFVGEEADLVAEEFAAEQEWRERTYVARQDGDIVGVVLAAIDEGMGRVWWFGPWGSPHEARLAVFDAAVAALPAGITEEEFGPDLRNHAVAAIAEQRGCARNTGSFVLTMDELVVPTVPTADVTVVEGVPPEHRDALSSLHEQLFPGTHTTGARLLAAEDTTLLVAVDDEGAFLGYVAGQVQPDGTGYVDYLGTAPDARRRGVATSLLTGLLRRWHDAGVPSCFLTVREDRPGARALYERLGFVTERTIVPWRRGFDLG